MCDLLMEKWPEEFRTIKYFQKPIVAFWPKQLLNIYTSKFIAFFLNLWTRLKIRKMLNDIEDGDCVYLLEYVHPELDIMRPLIPKLNSKGKNIKIYGMAHFTPSFMKRQFDMDAAKLQGWSEKVNLLLTLGSSLSRYFIELGTPQNKVVTLFHYVDLQYYRPFDRKEKAFGVIVQGNLQRNFDLVEKVISKCPSVHFSLLCGRLTLPQFERYDNVSVWSYISENKLRELMNNADVSLNIMDDTVGSNVIVTSMAMGLAMIVSDVGSIHDYCDDTNAVFCNTADDYCNAIIALSSNNTMLINMKSASLKKSSYLSIERFHDEIDKL